MAAVPAQGALPGQNGKIAFSSAGAGGTSSKEIYAINPDGSGQVQLTNNAAEDDQPAFSPDGTKIAFESRRDLDDSGFPNGEIYVMNADGTGVTRLTTDLDNNDLWPSWSPDGTKIAFYKGGDIWVMNADGSNPTKLTTDPALAFRPAWSPQGDKIAFVSSRDGNFEIYAINADGTNETRLTTDPDPNSPVTDTEPNFSPDGTKIAFRSSRANSDNDIFVMNADGTNPTNLTTAPDALGDFEPAFSPDGTQITFWSTRDGENAEIFAMNADGTGATQLTHTGIDVFNSAPDWQPMPPAVSIGDTTVVEGSSGTTDASFTVSLSVASTQPVKIDYSTADDTATAPADYAQTTGSLTFAPGETSKTISVAVNGDTLDEPDERFFVNLSGPQSATVADAQATGTITDDDVAPTVTATPTVSSPIPTPTATAGPNLVRERPGLSVSVRPKRDRRRPYRFTTRGRIKPPSGVSTATSCTGKVRITLKRKGHAKTLSSRLANLRSSCRFTSKVRFKNRKRFGKGRRGTLRFIVRFQGNSQLLPRTATRTARYG